MSKYRWIYTTWPEAALAEGAARTLVEERLCACANILPGMRSVYRWQGAVEIADEAVMILKADARTTGALQSRLRELHPATTPCFLALRIDAGMSSPDFLAWLSQSSRQNP
ncbi:divalent-cation tolerance protein CutA [Maricaulis sp.]|uniref:divalent-cation tolerance protein CutA n=1 Tax=Maricaulis sp. TaxID=1486257 RepID=UPI003A900B86